MHVRCAKRVKGMTMHIRFVKPSRKIDPAETKINNISDNMVESANPWRVYFLYYRCFDYNLHDLTIVSFQMMFEIVLRGTNDNDCRSK